MRHIVFVTALLGLSALDCSSSKTSGPAYPDAESFCIGLAKKQCNATVQINCLGASSETNSTACISNREGVCNETIVAPAQARGLLYDSVQAEACVNVTGAAYADASISSKDVTDIATACGSVFSSMHARNSICTSDADCKRSDGLTCVIHPSKTESDAGAPEGTCQPSSTPVPGGNSCAAPDAVCIKGYHCAATLHCEQDVAPPGACNTVDVCASTARCSSDGICVVKLANGAQCTADTDCQSGVCLDGTAPICVDSQPVSGDSPFCVDIRQQ